MLINALGRALPADRERLEQWLEKEEGTYAPEEKIAAVTELYDKMGVRALCDEKSVSILNGLVKFWIR